MMTAGQEFRPDNLTQVARSSGATAADSRRALLRDTASHSGEPLSELDRVISDLEHALSQGPSPDRKRDRAMRRLVAKLRAKREQLLDAATEQQQLGARLDAALHNSQEM